MLLTAFALMTVFWLVPFLTERFAQRKLAFEAPEQVAAQSAQAKPQAILSNTVSTLHFSEGESVYPVDISIYGGKLLFAAGEQADAFVRFDPETGLAEQLDIRPENDFLRAPVENADALFYLDALSEGGGSIRRVDKATGENTILCAASAGARKLLLEEPYLVWTEQADKTRTRLVAYDYQTGKSVTLALFDNDSPYASSQPSLKSGQVLYADEDADQAGCSLICAVLPNTGTRLDYAAGAYVHDPKSAGDRWAYLAGDHGDNADLYVVNGGGTPRRIARGATDFDITPACVAFGRDETVFAYLFADDRIYVLSETATNAQFVLAAGDYVIWRDCTNPKAPVWKYIKVV